MKWKICISVFAVLLLVFLFRPILFNHPTQQDLTHNVFGNQQNYDALANSTNVTAQRLQMRDITQFNSNTNQTKLNGYIPGAAIRLTPTQARQIQQLLQSPSSYDSFEVEKSCLPHYGVLVNFYSSQPTVRVALCFSCNQMGVFCGDDENSESIGEGDFDPGRAQFVALAKAIFPRDQEIQSLREKTR